MNLFNSDYFTEVKLLLSSIRNFAITFVISFVTFAALACLIVSLVFGTGNKNELPNDMIVSGTDDSFGFDTSDEDDTREELQGDSFNMLFLGLDYAPSLFYDIYDPESVAGLVDYESEIEAGSSVTDGIYREISADTIMLVCVSKEREEFAFATFSPYTVVSYKGESVYLGRIFEEYGIGEFKKTVERLSGLTVDRYAVVSMNEFPDMLNIIDGVTFNVPCDMKYTDNRGQLNINIKAGMQNLNGEDALKVLRFNSYEGTEHSRMKTTIEFAKAVMRKLTSEADIRTYITKATALFKKADGMFITDFTTNDLNANLDLIFSYSRFSPVTIDIPGEYRTVGGVLTFVPNAKGCTEAFRDYKR